MRFCSGSVVVGVCLWLMVSCRVLLCVVNMSIGVFYCSVVFNGVCIGMLLIGISCY